jgi:hypothetical protein
LRKSLNQLQLEFRHPDCQLLSILWPYDHIIEKDLEIKPGTDDGAMIS